MAGPPISEHEEGREVGERVSLRKRRTQESNVVLDARWAEGEWPGRRWGTIHHRIAVKNEEVEVRSGQCPPFAERCSR